jgi:hypothetical protein
MPLKGDCLLVLQNTSSMIHQIHENIVLLFRNDEFMKVILLESQKMGTANIVQGTYLKKSSLQ